MSGNLTCKSVEQNIENRKSSESAMKTMSSITTFGVSDLLDNNKSPSSDPVVNIIKNNYRAIKEKISHNNCQNVSTINQQNILIQPSICYTAINETCTNDKTGIPDINCLDMLYSILDSYSNKPITQTNINKLSSICEINSALQVLSEQEQNLENLTAIQLIHDAKSKAMEAKPADWTCNEISTNITSEKYTRSLLSCINQTTLDQENIITACTPELSAQVNVNNDIKKCLINVGVIGTSKQQSGTIIPPTNNTTPPTNYTTMPTNNTTQNTKTTPPNNNTTPANNNITQLTGIPIIYIILITVVVILIIVIAIPKPQPPSR